MKKSKSRLNVPGLYGVVAFVLILAGCSSGGATGDSINVPSLNGMWLTTTYGDYPYTLLSIDANEVCKIDIDNTLQRSGSRGTYTVDGTQSTYTELEEFQFGYTSSEGFSCTWDSIEPSEMESTFLLSSDGNWLMAGPLGQEGLFFRFTPRLVTALIGVWQQEGDWGGGPRTLNLNADGSMSLTVPGVPNLNASGRWGAEGNYLYFEITHLGETLQPCSQPFVFLSLFTSLNQRGSMALVFYTWTEDSEGNDIVYNDFGYIKL